MNWEPNHIEPSPGSQHSHWQGCRGFRDALGAGRGAGGSGGHHGVKGVRNHWGQLGCRVISGNWEAVRGCRRHQGVIRVFRGIRGHKGCGGCQGYIGVDWDPTTLDPSPGSQHCHWFPLGSDLPDHGWAKDTNEFCSLLYTFGTTFSDSLHICIYTA